MKRTNLSNRIITLAIILSSLALGQANDYYPTKTGLKWTYSNNTTQEFTGEKNVNGQMVSVLTKTLNGKVSSEEYFQSSVKGMNLLGFRAGGKLYWYNPPMNVYPAAPLASGMRWSSSSKSSLGTVALTSRVLGSEGVTTPGGRFNAFRIRSSVTTSTGGSSVSDLYFVPSVGTVRYVTQDGSTVDLTGR